MLRYRVRGEIHRGRTATIVEADLEGEAGFRRTLALKFLDPDASAEDRASFADEAEILARIRHSNVVSIFDFGTLEDRPYLAMELIEGISAATASERRMPIEAALFVVREIALALAHVHELGVIHRDVTPNNVMLGWDGSAILCDFGIALAPKRRNVTTVGIGKGTPQYMAPEQRFGSGADARTDVFSLGCVLHRLMAGASPAEDPQAIAIAPELPKLAASIVRRAVQVDPKDRYQTATELGQAAADALVEVGALDARTNLVEWLAPLRAPAPRASHPLLELFGEQAQEEPRRRTQVEEKPDESITPADTVNELVGEVAHGYLLLECIGRGRSADVFLAQHQVLRHHAAVKVFRTGGDGERALRQAQALSRLWHPGFAKALDSGLLADGRRFVVTELVRGKTLDKVERSRIPPASIIGQIASAIAEAHRHGIVHRSLSPANVMVSEDGLVKVLGFGSVKILSAGELTEAVGLRADPTYFAPEQFLAPSAVGPGADVYALGIIAFVLLEGAPPFTGSIYEMEKLHKSAALRSLARHGALGRLVDRMLEKDPRRRPSADQVALELAGLSQNKRRAVISGVTLAVLLAAVALVSGAAVRAFLLPRASPPQPPAAVQERAEPPPPIAAVPAEQESAESIDAIEEAPIEPPVEPPEPIRKKAKRPSPIDPNRQLVSILRARHLLRSDLIEDDRASSLLAQIDSDPEALAELTRAADRIARQPEVVERKLDAVGRELAELDGKIDPKLLGELESEFFELRRAYRPSLDGEAVFALLERVAALSRRSRARSPQ